MPSLRQGLAAMAVAGMTVLSPAAIVPVVHAAAPAAAKHGHPRGLVPRTDRSNAGLASANPYCSACNPPLLFNQGSPVIGGLSGLPGHVTITPVYWAPSGYSFAASYRSVIDGYIQNVAAASSTTANVYSVNTQYYQQLSGSGPVQHIAYTVTAGADLDDSDPFPAQNSRPGCIADSGFTACISDGELQSELTNVLTAQHRAIDDSHLYVVMFPAAVETCEGPGAASPTNHCSTNVFCAYHSDASPPDLVYSNQPYPDMKHCVDPRNGPQTPNGDAEADAQVSLISHEANESITDWAGAWMDSAGYEDGDECAYVFGVPLGGAAGAYYNQVIGGGKYYTQDEFSNEDYVLGQGDLTGIGGRAVPGCVQREEPLVVSFTGPSAAAVGVESTFSAAAVDPDNPTAVLAYSWHWGDGSPDGAGVEVTHAFGRAGTYQVKLMVTAADWSSGSAVQSIVVTGSPSRSAVAQSSPAGTTSRQATQSSPTAQSSRTPPSVAQASGSPSPATAAPADANTVSSGTTQQAAQSTMVGASLVPLVWSILLRLLAWI